MTIFRTVVAGLLGGAVAASAAAARCPVPGDLATGIRINYLGIVSEIYRAGPEGTVTVEGFTNGVLDRRLTLLHGVFLARYIGVNPSLTPDSGDDREEDAQSESVYGFPTGAFGPSLPQPGAQWQGEVLVNEGGGTRAEAQTHIAGPLEQIIIAGCTYDGFRIDVNFGEEVAYSESLVYLPSLGMGFLVAFASNGGETQDLRVETLETLE